MALPFTPETHRALAEYLQSVDDSALASTVSHCAKTSPADCDVCEALVLHMYDEEIEKWLADAGRPYVHVDHAARKALGIE